MVVLPWLGSWVRQAVIAAWSVEADCPVAPGWTPCCLRQAWYLAKVALFAAPPAVPAPAPVPKPVPAGRRLRQAESAVWKAVEVRDVVDPV